MHSLHTIIPQFPCPTFLTLRHRTRWNYTTGVIGRLERGNLIVALVDADRCWDLAAILVAGDADRANYIAPGVGRAKPILVDRGFNPCKALVDAGTSLRGGGFGPTVGKWRGKR